MKLAALGLEFVPFVPNRFEHVDVRASIVLATKANASIVVLVSATSVCEDVKNVPGEYAPNVWKNTEIKWSVANVYHWMSK